MFKPLVNEIPGFGAVVYSLRELVSTFYLLMNIEDQLIQQLTSLIYGTQEKLDFRLKLVGGEVTAVPGIDKIIMVCVITPKYLSCSHALHG